MAPHSPSGLWRRMVNLIARTRMARTTTPINIRAECLCQSSCVKSQTRPNPAAQNHESPECAKNAAIFLRVVRDESNRKRRERSASRVKSVFISMMAGVYLELESMPILKDLRITGVGFPKIRSKKIDNRLIKRIMNELKRENFFLIIRGVLFFMRQSLY